MEACLVVVVHDFECGGQGLAALVVDPCTPYDDSFA
jgi:hypothetical protein